MMRLTVVRRSLHRGCVWPTFPHHPFLLMSSLGHFCPNDPHLGKIISESCPVFLQCCPDTRELCYFPRSVYVCFQLGLPYVLLYLLDLLLDLVGSVYRVRYGNI